MIDESGATGPLSDDSAYTLRRRTVLKAIGALGAGTLTFRRALAAQAAQANKVTPETMRETVGKQGFEGRIVDAGR